MCTTATTKLSTETRMTLEQKDPSTPRQILAPGAATCLVLRQVSASEEPKDVVAVDMNARRERRAVLATFREVDIGIGGRVGVSKDVGEPESALAEPVAEHRDVTAGKIDDAPFGGDEPRPRQM